MSAQAQPGPIAAPISRPRRAARLAAVQALYQIDLTGAAPGAVIEEFERHRFGRAVDGVEAAPVHKIFFAEIVHGVVGRRTEFDNMIAAVLADGWSVERLESVLGAILRAGTYELAALPLIPAPSVIDEYVQLARDFFTGKEPALVNGVLDCLARTLRPHELKGGDRGPILTESPLSGVLSAG